LQVFVVVFCCFFQQSKWQAMGICACSAGNHAQGVAFSAAALDISVPWELRVVRSSN